MYMHTHKNITNIHRNPQTEVCGYILVSAFSGKLAVGRDYSHTLLN